MYLYSQSFFSNDLSFKRHLSYVSDISADPTEHVDLSEKLPDVVKQLQAKMADYHKKIVPALWPKNDPASVPASHDDFWAPGWC